MFYTVIATQNRGKTAMKALRLSGQHQANPPNPNQLTVRARYLIDELVGCYNAITPNGLTTDSPAYQNALFSGALFLLYQLF